MSTVQVRFERRESGRSEAGRDRLEPIGRGSGSGFWMMGGSRAVLIWRARLG